jgi:uncharacterized membrane protein YiaA
MEYEVANFHWQTSDVYAYVWMVPGSLFSWISLWNLCHTLNRCKVAYFMENVMTPISHATKEYEVANFHWQTSDVYAYVWMVQGSLFSWITFWNLCHTLNRCKVAYFMENVMTPISHATKEYEVTNFHGQTSDVYAYVCMVQGSLFSWITLWNLCHTLNRYKVAYFHGTLHDSYSTQWRKVR